MENEILPIVPEKKKRGRKPKSEKIATEQETVPEVKVQKKRGRKPKGGKIVSNIKSIDSDNYVKTNIVLHLKCSIDDLNNKENENKEIQSYEISNNKNTNNNLEYEVLNNNELLVEQFDNSNNKEIAVTNENDEKLINTKLKSLQKELHKNDLSDKKSACFWCTYDFDNPPIYIPKFKSNDSYHVYGCFCSPECGVSYLMNENIDSSKKFERYQLLNFIYGKIYNYKINIKPAPDPYYLLDKFYGNLSIQEYRKLLRNDRLLMIIDKPLTRVLPELHEENNDFLSMKNSTTNNSTYQIRKKTVSNSKLSNNIF